MGFLDKVSQAEQVVKQGQDAVEERQAEVPPTPPGGLPPMPASTGEVGDREPPSP